MSTKAGWHLDFDLKASKLCLYPEEEARVTSSQMFVSAPRAESWPHCCKTWLSVDAGAGPSSTLHDPAAPQPACSRPAAASAFKGRRMKQTGERAQMATSLSRKQTSKM